MSEELKPCPFCGGEAKKWSMSKRRVSISCPNHKCFPRPHVGVVNNNADEIATKAWNTRTHPAPNEGDVQEALSSLKEVEMTISDILEMAHRNGVTALSRFKFNQQCETICATLTRQAEQSEAVLELAFIDSNEKTISYGDVLKSECFNEEVHGNHVWYEVININGAPVLSYLTSEKGQVLPKGYTRGFLTDRYDAKLALGLKGGGPSITTPDEHMVIDDNPPPIKQAEGE